MNNPQTEAKAFIISTLTKAQVANKGSIERYPEDSYKASKAFVGRKGKHHRCPKQ